MQRPKPNMLNLTRNKRNKNSISTKIYVSKQKKTEHIINYHPN